MGYLYNDIKVNNVVFEKIFIILEKLYSFVFIDFGKSIKVVVSFMMLWILGRKWIVFEYSLKSYLVLEVIKEWLYSVVSDVYSLGKMLKVVFKMVGFYLRVRLLVKEVIVERLFLRFFFDNFVVRFGVIKF